LKTLKGLLIGNRFSSWCLQGFIPHNSTTLHEAQEAIETLQGKQEAKEDKVMNEEERTIINEDGSKEWEDVEDGN
jgi:hypothetical protein